MPYVLYHGSWPHGEDWLYEAAAETYLPLLSIIDRCVFLNCNPKLTIGLTPVLLEQLAHRRFKGGFREYLDVVFMYAGSSSLSKELHAVPNIHEMRSGDVFIQGGFPGHAVMAVDTATSDATGKKRFLLAQSYMPAQDIHILRNPNSSRLSPWYDMDFGDKLRTPEWTFRKGDLRRF